MKISEIANPPPFPPRPPARTPETVNVALCNALGIEDLRNITSVVLLIRAGQLPQLRVQRVILPSDGGAAVAAVERLRLRAAP